MDFLTYVTNTLQKEGFGKKELFDFLEGDKDPCYALRELYFDDADIKIKKAITKCIGRILNAKRENDYKWFYPWMGLLFLLVEDYYRNSESNHCYLGMDKKIEDLTLNGIFEYFIQCDLCTFAFIDMHQKKEKEENESKEIPIEPSYEKINELDNILNSIEI